MRRFEIAKRRNNHQEIEIAAKPPPTISLEMDETTLHKLLSGEPFDKDDITKCANKLFEKYNFDLDRQFKLAEKIQDLDNRFDNIELQTHQPIFVVFAKEENRWVLFCLVQEESKTIILYKDPCGVLVSYKLEKKIKQIFEQVEFISQTKQDQHEDEESSYGPLTVRNLEIVLGSFKQDPDNFVKKFKEMEFSHSRDLDDYRLNEVVQLTTRLSKNDEFKRDFKTFVDNLPLDLSLEMMEYNNVLKEEIGKEKIDYEKISRVRNTNLNIDKIKQFEKECKKIMKKKEGTPTEDYEAKIEKKFPREMQRMNDVFTILGSLTVNEQFYTLLHSICRILDIDYDKLEKLYRLKSKREEKPMEKKKKKLPVEDIDAIEKKTGTQKKKAGEGDCTRLSNTRTETSLEDLLQELNLGKDGSDVPQEALLKLKRKYNLVKAKYNSWMATDLRSIKKWAVDKRGYLGSDDDEICETIAIMDRVFNLTTPNWRFRIPQILTVLIFLDSKDNGRLCQIQTGEGKTLIVSLLAVIRVLQGYTVDVITSNSVLATKDKEECQNFYSIFNITVATNNPLDDKICYEADVLYGTISNFQFDYLRDTFEGHNIRSNRKFGQVILDEVDSMLIDNGGHIAKLATPYPGMESLRYIYIKIWQELQNAEENFVKETETKAKELLQTYSDADEAKQHFEKFFQEINKSERKIIKMKIKENLTEISLTPNHLKDYVTRKLDVWIKNALHAKYNCHEHRQYRIVCDDGEDIITPVDYMNTGVTMRNTVWSNGLHQFVQLKHNLRLTFESLTSSYISNIGYIKKYKDENIFGMTGTLGSSAEQNLLSDIYNLNYAKISPYTKKNFQELPGIVVDDDEWSNYIVLEILENIDEGRAVLVICETVEDLLAVEGTLQIFEEDLKIKKFLNEDNAQEAKKKVKIGDVILATNIAGRGTNFKTDACLENNGGLHVCVGFLPYNLRVEEQAFGRTSRQGNEGTARLIIRQSEVDELAISEEKPDFTQIKTERDRLERERLQQVDNVLLKEIIFKDKIFARFSEFQREWNKENKGRAKQFVLQDLRECWAFWLDKKNYKADNIKNVTPEEEFENFKNEARPIIEGEISHNPYYSIALAENFLQADDTNEASKNLTRAIELGGSNKLPGASLKLFEIALIDNNVFWEKLKNAMLRFILLDFGGTKFYKTKAKVLLNRAKDSIEKEVAHIDQLLSTENIDFQKIVVRDKNNHFLEHIYSRLHCLKLHQDNIENLLKQMNEYAGVTIGGKIATTIEKIKEIDSQGNSITSLELTELHLSGIDVFYDLKEYRDVPEETLRLAQGQLVAGFAALAVGIAFLPIYPIMQAIASTLICDGIIELVIAVLSEDNEFNLMEYIKDKFISYSIDIITFGVSKIFNCIKVIKAALKFVRKTSNFLRRSTYLKRVFSKLANKLDDFEKFLNTKILTIKFNKLDKVDQLKKLKMWKQTDITKFHRLNGTEKLQELLHLKKIGMLKRFKRSKLLGEFTKKVFRKVGKRIVGIITEKYVIRPLFNLAFEEIYNKIKRDLINATESNANCLEKIRTTPPAEITKVVENFLKTNELQDVFERFITGFIKKADTIYMECLLFAYNYTKGNVMIIYLKQNFTTYLERRLQGGENNNVVDPLIETICSQVADDIFNRFYDVMKTNFQFGKKVLKKALAKPKITASEIVHTPAVSSEENDKKKYYTVLGLQMDATVEDAEKQYRTLTTQLHPDKNQTDPDATKKFQALQDAYEKILPKEEMREYYKELNLKMNANLKDAKRQYWNTAMNVHPSRHGDDPEMAEQFKKVNTAHKKIVNYLKGIEENPATTVFVVNPEGEVTTQTE
ncbi:hypothetical protein Zmor_008382 [Zophobas morio]|uniref:Protein translocase subunit SecA n=1 Tax=Zophobas morio TaxID=2755281 RepID=A0AA38MQS3_9CUCU|nr:hypothetical protein Zmor_008382 [Zophobas morio]